MVLWSTTQAFFSTYSTSNPQEVREFTSSILPVQNSTFTLRQTLRMIPFASTRLSRRDGAGLPHSRMVGLSCPKQWEVIVYGPMHSVPIPSALLFLPVLT